MLKLERAPSHPTEVSCRAAPLLIRPLDASRGPLTGPTSWSQQGTTCTLYRVPYMVYLRRETARTRGGLPT